MQSTLSVRKKSLVESGSTTLCSGAASADVTSTELQHAVLRSFATATSARCWQWSSVRCFCEYCSLGTHDFVTPRARPSNSTSTPRRGDVFLFLRKFYALVVVWKVLFFLFAGLIYYLLQGKLLLIFPFWLVDIPEQRRAGNHAYILEFRPCLFGLVGIYYRLRGAVCFMFSFSHFFYSRSRIVWNFFGRG